MKDCLIIHSFIHTLSQRLNIEENKIFGFFNVIGYILDGFGRTALLLFILVKLKKKILSIYLICIDTNVSLALFVSLEQTVVNEAGKPIKQAMIIIAYLPADSETWMCRAFF